MNQDVFSGQWKQMRGTLKSWWGRLTDDDFDRVGGQKDKLIGVVQERYGQTRQQAEQEVERRLSEYGQMGATAGESASKLKAKVDEFGATVSHKASDATSAVTSGVQTARSYFHDRDLDDVSGDIAGLVRRYPIQACLIGIGLGYLLARSTLGLGERSRID
ncbi:MAG: CsbD family protein [Deltaproteobacteria bacterium]|nr:CsbD family protein [Deltaproteobacteria bacterium]